MEETNNITHNEEIIKEVVEQKTNVVEQESNVVEQESKVVEQESNVVEQESKDLTIVKTETLVIDENTKTLLIILKTLISENDEFNNMMNKISIKLGNKEREFLIKILEQFPETFEKIELSMKNIVSDNKIDTKDVPDMLSCIQELYQMIYKFKTNKLDTKKRCELCATIIKFVIHILVEERIIKIDEERKVEFLSSTDILIDSAISLIGLSKLIKPTGCFKKLFGKK